MERIKEQFIMVLKSGRKIHYSTVEFKTPELTTVQSTTGRLVSVKTSEIQSVVQL